MQRYFVLNNHFHDEHVTIGDEDAHHIDKVMRMKAGDSLIVCDQEGRSFLCQIQEMEKHQIICHIVKELMNPNELPIKVTLVQGLPKGDKLDLIVQKATELGVTAFIPFASERAIVKWDQPQKVSKKLERLKKIAKEASEQSHRNTIPDVESPLDLKGLLQLKDTFTHKMVAYEEEAKQGERRGFANLLASMKPGDSLLVVVGPEGGLSPEEVDELVENGFIKAGLGPRILRTETAPMYILAALSYQFELAMR